MLNRQLETAGTKMEDPYCFVGLFREEVKK